MAKKQNSFNPAAGLFSQPTPPPPERQPEEGPAETAAPLTAATASGPQADLVRGTQGRKGYKLPRINMAFTPENHAFIKSASRREGVSITEYVNRLIDQARRQG